VSLHRLLPGRRLIAALERLGRILDYHVQLEHPLPTEHSRESPAIDVAWFGSQDDPFPLMLFEVESGASNAMASNAMKVLSQDSSVFEKPLFFFHIVVAGGSQSTRPQMLERQFGQHNYRIYRLGDGEGTRLVCDILSQHRRIRSHLPFAMLFEACRHPDWGEAVDAIAVLHTARDSGISRKQYLPDLLSLAVSHRYLLSEIESAVCSPAETLWFDASAFRSWIGQWFGRGILLAMLCGLARSEEAAAQLSNRFAEWQRGSGGLQIIGPYSGLSQEYEEYLVQVAGASVGLFVALAPQAEFCLPLLRALIAIAKQFRNRYAANLLAWGCHVAAFLNSAGDFIEIKSMIAMLGGMPEELLYAPHPITEDDVAWDEETEIITAPSSIENFRRDAAQRHRSADSDLVGVALRALEHDDFLPQWSIPILMGMWSQPAPEALS
jgi:hypothetical protein